MKKSESKEQIEREAAAELFQTIDFEGGFYEAFVKYGIDLEKYKLNPELKERIEGVVEELQLLDQIINGIMFDLEEADSLVCGDEDSL